MSVRLRPLTATLALAAVVGLVASGCGGGGSSDGASKTSSGGSGTTATTAADSGSLPDYKPEKRTFEEVDGSKARFVNVLAANGKGIDYDVYWGMDAETGKKAATVKYGEVSDWVPMQVEKDPMFTNDDGSQDVNVVFYQAGKTDQASRIQQQAEKLEGDMALTYTMGWTKSYGDSTQIPSSLGVGFDHEAGKPPAGKAWVAINTGGVGGIEGGDFMVLSSATGCQDLVGTDIEGGTANSGQAFLVDPGTQSFTASDANTDCSVRTDPVSLDLKAGDRYVIYAYGTSKDDRKLMAVKVGE